LTSARVKHSLRISDFPIVQIVPAVEEDVFGREFVSDEY
jgi:hypothetical protein